MQKKSRNYHNGHNGCKDYNVKCIVLLHYFYSCSLGGPLMYYEKKSNQYVLIGTVKGHGYDCRDDNVTKFEGSTNGVWNKVSAHMEWIQDTMDKLGEKGCWQRHN